MIPHFIRADTGVADLVSLNLFVAIVGPAGAGKSSGMRVSQRLVTPPIAMDFRDGLPIGSGEGMAEIFMGTADEPTGNQTKKGEPIFASVRTQVRHNAFFYVDEGQSLTRLMKERSGSTLSEALRSAAVGQSLGQTNASKDTTRYIPAGTYSMGMLVGFQPETAAPLFEDVAEGTPQRFLWGVVTDPNIPDEAPDEPGELSAYRMAFDVTGFKRVTFDKEITAEIRRADLANARGEAVDTNPLDAHAPVMKVKVASLMAILAGKLHVTVDDWQLSDMVWRASCEARDAVIEYSVQQQRTERLQRLEAHKAEEVSLDEAKEEARRNRAILRTDRMAKRLAARVHEAGIVGLSARQIRDLFSRDDRPFLDDAKNRAATQGWVVEVPDQRRTFPGHIAPS